jgi:hypothetical protein
MADTGGPPVNTVPLEHNLLPTPSPSPRHRVMRLLASPPDAALAAANEIEVAGEWPAVLRLCERWKGLPAVAARLAALGRSLPPAEADELRRATAAQFIRTSLCLRAGSEAMQRLHAVGIKAAAFKGCAVIALLHANGRDRMLQDVDILIRADELSVTLTTLEAHGYRRDIASGSLADYIAFVKHSPGAAGNQAVSLSNPAGNHIDLHWKLGRFDTEALLTTARPVRVLNVETTVVRPAFGLLLTVHHAVRNDLIPDEIARDILDCGGWFRLLATDPEELSYALDYARRWGLDDAVRAVSMIVQHFGGDSPLPTAATGSTAAALADLYLRQLDSEPINSDLPYLASPRAIGQILSGALSGWRRYAGLMREFEAANGEASLTLSERAKRLATAAWQLSPAQWRQVRALARAKDRLL